jgi:alpha-amylase
MKLKQILMFAWCFLVFYGLMAQNRAIPFTWENATVYFVMTDRFENGDPTNDFSYGRQQDGVPLRSFLGGDLKGLTNKINSGYFDDLGVSAIWITPPYENIHGTVPFDNGSMYAFHGYWAKDWTAIDANLGNEVDFRNFVDAAHNHGIRIIMDIVINHVGPDTAIDQSWPSDWVRRDPTCNFNGPGGTIPCELVDNLPDIRTESNTAVNLPQWLLDKWQAEGRRNSELNELNAFFNRTGYPRAPRFYIIKWLTDYVREFGVDAFRVDTVKHVEETVWAELKQEAIVALQEWKAANPAKKVDDAPFWMCGEVFNYDGPAMQRRFTGDGYNVDYYDNGFDNLIDFGFRFNADNGLESLFSTYNNLLQNQLGGKSVMNFTANHDTDVVFDRNRTRTFEAGTKLLLAPSTAQIYYGDETARTLTPNNGATGDATLRSFMNFQELDNPNSLASLTLTHYQKIGRFRREHVSVGGGVHTFLQGTPYAFKREYNKNGLADKTLVFSGQDGDFDTSMTVFGMWPEGTLLKDYFSGNTAIVSGNTVNFNSPFGLLLIGEPLNNTVTPQLTINPQSGCFANEVQVTMSATENASIYYTTDGSTPSTSATLYTQPFLLSNTTSLQAIAVSSNGGQSEIEIRNYEVSTSCQGATYRIYMHSPDDWNENYIYLFNTSTNSVLQGTQAWPGQLLTKLQGTQSWYFYDVVLPAGVTSSEIGIVFNNNSGSQSVDLFRPDEGWFDFSSGGSVRNGNWSANCPTDCPSASTSYTVYMHSPTDWNANYIYLFNSSSNTTLQGTQNWPGQSMLKLPGTNNWYYFEIVVPSGTSASEIGIVFNNNNNGSQSVDLFSATQGWFDFTTGGSMRTGNWTSDCQVDCEQTTSAGEEVAELIESENVLKQNLQVYPNPSNGNTNFRYKIAVQGEVNITVFDISGRKLATVFNGLLSPGIHNFSWNYHVPGIYLYTLSTGKEKINGKLIIQ